MLPLYVVGKKTSWSEEEEQMAEDSDLVNELSNYTLTNDGGNQAAGYIRDGLFTATNTVFWGLVVVALCGLGLVLLTPEKFEALYSDSPEVATEAPKQPEEEQPVR